jgi:hypothetical protein
MQREDAKTSRRVDLDPLIWGPCAWRFLLDCAVACDRTSSVSYRRLIELLPSVLPCGTCRGHARSYIEANPVTSDTPEQLRSWILRFQAAVRERTCLDLCRDMQLRSTRSCSSLACPSTSGVVGGEQGFSVHEITLALLLGLCLALICRFAVKLCSRATSLGRICQR